MVAFLVKEDAPKPVRMITSRLPPVMALTTSIANEPAWASVSFLR